MLINLKKELWQQFGASIDMLNHAIAAWPDLYWYSEKRFFYMAYHTVVFLDYYLTLPPPAIFSSSLPFTFAEPEAIPPDAIDDIIPNEIYSKAELQNYLQRCRLKCQQFIDGLTEEKLMARWKEADGQMDYSAFEILLYNMRHVQHHAAQLNLLLRQKLNHAPGWEARAEDTRQ